MFETEDFGSRLIEYGQMPSGEMLRELYNLNEMKKEVKIPFLLNLVTAFGPGGVYTG